MPIPLPPGCLAATLCRADECEGCAPLFANRDAALAALALTPALLDPAARAALRGLAVDHAGGAAFDRMDDHAVLAVLGAAVAAGRLHLCNAEADAEPGAEATVESDVDRGVASKSAEIAGAPSPAPPAPRSQAPAPPAPRPPPPPPPPAAEAAPEIDAAAQAATLIEAARSGVPFCEECEKARAAAAAAAATAA